MSHMIRPTWRRELLENLEGEILEVGVGTGINLAYYPPDAHVTAIDFSPKMLAKAIPKMKEARANITLMEMDAEQMSFPDNTFDTIVSTCVFCSVPDPVKGLQEIRRVVKREGKILMLEHMRSESTVGGRLLDLINPLTVRFSAVNVNRKTIENIEKAGLKIDQQTNLMTTIMRKLIISPNK